MQVLRKSNEIYDGWKNFIFPNKGVEEVAKKRLGICLKCNYSKKIVLNKLIPVVRKVEYWGCSLCRCPIEKKVRSLKTSCPKKYW